MTMKKFLLAITALAATATPALAVDCPSYWLDADGERYNVNWTVWHDGNKEATGTVFADATPDFAEYSKAALNNYFESVDCSSYTIEQIEAINAGISSKRAEAEAAAKKVAFE